MNTDSLERVVWVLNFHETGEAVTAETVAKQTGMEWAEAYNALLALKKLSNITPNISSGDNSTIVDEYSKNVDIFHDSEPERRLVTYIFSTLYYLGEEYMVEAEETDTLTTLTSKDGENSKFLDIAFPISEHKYLKDNRDIITRAEEQDLVKVLDDECVILTTKGVQKGGVTWSSVQHRSDLSSAGDFS